MASMSTLNAEPATVDPGFQEVLGWVWVGVGTWDTHTPTHTHVVAYISLKLLPINKGVVPTIHVIPMGIPSMGVVVGNIVKTILKGGDVWRAWLQLVCCTPYLRRRSDTSLVYGVESVKSEAMYEAYGKLINEMHNRKLESGENLYGDIQKEKENGDEMEMGLEVEGPECRI
ncbi:hypothetical protein EDB19DRAFT_1829335 [Suillus lakei]|nr:hypothetical protein EDB19DRAFT_1829335 [Suillus lakei]